MIVTRVIPPPYPQCVSGGKHGQYYRFSQRPSRACIPSSPGPDRECARAIIVDTRPNPQQLPGPAASVAAGSQNRARWPISVFAAFVLLTDRHRTRQRVNPSWPAIASHGWAPMLLQPPDGMGVDLGSVIGLSSQLDVGPRRPQRP